MMYKLLPKSRSLSPSAAPRDASKGRVLIVANRLPLTLATTCRGVRFRQSSGGLATGLKQVQRRHRSRWIGWTGLPDRPTPLARREIDVRLRATGMKAVHLSRHEVTRFYRRYSNSVLWPALHDIGPATHESSDWETYRAVNARFAEAVVRELRVGDFVWVHDYHLMLVPRLVREQCPQARIGFFLHTPFPPAESFARLPQAAVLLDGLLGSDAIGLHTDDYVGNLREAVDATRLYRTHNGIVDDHHRPVSTFACPMSIDAAALGAISARTSVVAEAARLRGNGPLFVGVDRLDYTKGIPERLRAFERLLERDDALIGRARLVQIAVPSREELSAYKRVRQEVEETVKRINERWGNEVWQPVSYHYGTVELTALVALYRAADVMLVTPIRDGMNLVAKEFVASRVDNDGVLVLSDRAGAAAELRTALLVDPTDESALTDAYVAALNMLPAERRVRMRHMRSSVIAHDVYRWAESVLGALAGDNHSWSRASHA
jgi:trehalose 6-phosphate synthase/phosphatase